MFKPIASGKTPSIHKCLDMIIDSLNYRSSTQMAENVLIKLQLFLWHLRCFESETILYEEKKRIMRNCNPTKRAYEMKHVNIN